MKYTHLLLSGGLFAFVIVGNVAAQQVENLLKFGDFENVKVDLKQLPMNNWAGTFYVHQKDGEALRTKMTPLVTRQISEDNPASGTRCVVLITPLTVNEFRDAKGKPEISNRINQSIIVPETTEPVKYQLTFKSRGKYENTPGLNSLRAFVMCYNNTERSQGKQLGDVEVGFPLKPDWQNNSTNFVAPAGTRLIFISLALYGCGQVFLDDVELKQLQ
jgi:hypothetical protein